MKDGTNKLSFFVRSHLRSLSAFIIQFKINPECSHGSCPGPLCFAPTDEHISASTGEPARRGRVFSEAPTVGEVNQTGEVILNAAD